MDLGRGRADGRADRLYAVVHLDRPAARPGGPAEVTVRGVVMPFPTARSAELFAFHNGYTDFDVTAIAFVPHTRPAGAPAEDVPPA